MIKPTDLRVHQTEDFEWIAGIPSFLIDKIDQDILQDPVRASDGLIYSRSNIVKWFSVCESLHKPMSSPLTLEDIDGSLEPVPQLKTILDNLENRIHQYRRTSLVDGFKRSCLKRKPSSRLTDGILSLHRLSKLHNATAGVPNIPLEDISLFCETPKLAFIGEVGCGKSCLIEKLTMYSLFPNGDKTIRTRMPIIVKMRHSQKNNHSFPVLRVIDTSKKVQLGEAIILPCMDTANDRIRSIMEEVYMSEMKMHRLHKKKKSQRTALSRMSSRESIGDYPDSIDDMIMSETQSVGDLSDETESKQSSFSHFTIGSLQDYGVCVDRALVVHLHSPYVPTIDIVDFPGLLPPFQHKAHLNSSGDEEPGNGRTDQLHEEGDSNGDTECGPEEELQWEIWRQNRLGLVEMHSMAHPRSMYVAAIEARPEHLAASPALALVKRLDLQARTVGVITKCDLFVASINPSISPTHNESSCASPSSSTPVKTGSDHATAIGIDVSSTRTPSTQPHSIAATVYSLKWSVLSGDSYSAAVSGIRPPIRLGGGYVFTTTHSTANSTTECAEIHARVDTSSSYIIEGVQTNVPCCKYSDVIRQRLSESSWFMFNEFEDALLAGHASCDAVVQVLQHLHTDHMREKWTPMVLKTLVDRRLTLLQAADALGLPAPVVCVQLSEDAVNRLCKDHPVSRVASASKSDLDSSLIFLEDIGLAAKHCIFAGIHSMRACFVSSVLGPFMSRLFACLPKSEVTVHDCFVPGNSVDSFLKSIRVMIEDACASLLLMMEEYWANAVTECLITDKSPCRLGRFAITPSDREALPSSDLMKSIHVSVMAHVSTLYQGLDEELRGIIGSFVSLISHRGAVGVRYDMEDRKACKAHLRLNLSDMVHTLIAVATADERLVTEYGLTQAVKTGIVNFMRYNTGQLIPESSAEERKTILAEAHQCEAAVRNILSILIDDMSGVGYYGADREILLQVTATRGSRDKRSMSKDFSRNLYAGAWGGVGFGVGDSRDVFDKSSTNSPAASVGIRDELTDEVESLLATNEATCEDAVDCSYRDALLLGMAAAGLKVSKLKEVGFSANDLRVGGFTAGQLISAGFTIDDLREGGYALADDKYAGFTLSQLRESGGVALSVLAAQRRVDGVSAESMASDGFTFTELQEAGYDLFEALQRGSIVEKLDAVRCVQELARQDESSDVISSGVVDLLISLLYSVHGSDECKDAAAGALGALACCPENKILLANAGAIPALVGLLQSDIDSSKESAAWALRNLARESGPNMIAIAQAGAIDPLVEQLLYGTDSYKEAAARALCHLAFDNNNIAAIASAGAIEPLVRLLEHPNDRFKEAAARALCNLACDDSNLRTIAISGAISQLVGLLSSPSDRCKEAAAYALRNIACDESYVKDICALDAVDKLIYMLSIDAEGGKVQEAAASALGGLACSQENKIIIGEAGAVKELVQMVEKCDDKRCETAVWVLGSLVNDMSNKQRFINAGGVSVLTAQLRRGTDAIKEACAWGFRYLVHGCYIPDVARSCSPAIPLLVHMLTHCGCDGAKEAAAWAICSLACDISCCMTVVDAGALGPLMSILRSGEESCKEAAAFALQNIGPTELRQAGFTIPMLKEAGMALSVLAAQRRVDGVSAASMASDGFSFTILQEAGYDLSRQVMEGGPAEKIDALKCLLKLLGTSESLPVPFKADLIPGLLSLMRYENDEVLFHILNFLRSVVECDGDALIIAVEAGCVEFLSSLVGKESSIATCRLSAASTLTVMMARNPANKMLAANAGAISSAVSLVCTHARADDGNALCLLNLLLTDSSFAMRRDVVNDKECIGELVQLVQDAKSCNPRIQAACTIRLLAYDTHSKNILGATGVIPPLVEMLRNPSEQAAEAAVGALRSLAWYHNHNAMLIIDAGALNAMSKLLYRGSAKTQAESAWLLNSLVGYGSSLVKDVACLEPLVLLMRSQHESTSEAAICALGNLLKFDAACVEEVICLGGIDSMIALFRNGSSTSKMAAACCLNGLCGMERVADILKQFGITKSAIVAKMSG